jgi:hypothetical protein
LGLKKGVVGGQEVYKGFRAKVEVMGMHEHEFANRIILL